MYEFNPVDNLFNADHRAQMIDQYGVSEAQWVTVQEMMEYEGETNDRSN